MLKVSKDGKTVSSMDQSLKALNPDTDASAQCRQQHSFKDLNPENNSTEVSFPLLMKTVLYRQKHETMKNYGFNVT